MGVELPHPVINAQSLAYNFTNEGGVGGTFRLLKNIMGLWVVQECRRAWAAQGHDIGYPQLVDLAEAAPAFGPLAAMNDERWLPPGDMPARLRAYLSETSQPAPESMGALARCVLESLALEYRWVAERLDELAGQRAETIHIIGGGSQNALLNQFTADASGRTVIAGPVEATALGNVLVQAMAAGQLASLAEGRALVRRSFPTRTFEPGERSAWDEVYGRYLTLRP
jgi:rhamnulokinase